MNSGYHSPSRREKKKKEKERKRKRKKEIEEKKTISCPNPRLPAIFLSEKITT
jgi:hypothetical protein